MTKQHFYYLGLMLAVIAVQISGLASWADAIKPSFVGGSLAAIAVVLKALNAQPPSS